MISLTSIEETVLRTRRAILEAPLKRRMRIIVIILMVVLFQVFWNDNVFMV
jgi:hypothetical protein